MPAGTATVVLGLVAALAWGAGDFGGGLTSRKTAVFGVVLLSQLTGMAISLALATIRAESMPGPVDLGWSLLAGILGAIGITALYRGLALGRMGIVAPVTGVLAAVIPVAAGILLEGVPPPLVLFGIAIAIGSVVLVSRVADEEGGRAGLSEALIAGVSIGLFGVVIAQISDGLVFGPLTVVRGVQAVTLAVLILATGTAWRPAARLLPIIALIGILDMTGNAMYFFAVQTGLLAVAAVISSLYPVTTVILATIVLGERVSRDHAVGIALAVVAVACIGMGSA